MEKMIINVKFLFSSVTELIFVKNVGDENYEEIYKQKYRQKIVRKQQLMRNSFSDQVAIDFEKTNNLEVDPSQQHCGITPPVSEYYSKKYDHIFA